MIDKARERARRPAPSYLVADLAELELDEPVDVVFSTATFHWILDHERLFARLRAALRPGRPAGRPVRRRRATSPSYAEAIAEVAAQPSASRPTSTGSTSTWNFAAAEETEARLRGAGFAEARCWLRAEAGRPAGAAPRSSHRHASARTSTGCPRSCATPSSTRSLERPSEPLVLDYVRLNIEAAPAA